MVLRDNVHIARTNVTKLSWEIRQFRRNSSVDVERESDFVTAPSDFRAVDVEREYQRDRVAQFL